MLAQCRNHITIEQLQTALSVLERYWPIQPERENPWTQNVHHFLQFGNDRVWGPSNHDHVFQYIGIRGINRLLDCLDSFGRFLTTFTVQWLRGGVSTEISLSKATGRFFR